MEEKAKALIEEKLILYQTSVISPTFHTVRTHLVKEYIGPQCVWIHWIKFKYWIFQWHSTPLGGESQIWVKKIENYRKMIEWSNMYLFDKSKSLSKEITSFPWLIIIIIIHRSCPHCTLVLLWSRNGIYSIDTDSYPVIVALWTHPQHMISPLSH